MKIFEHWSPVIVLMASQRSNRKVFFVLVTSVQLGDRFCLDPSGGSIRDGTNVGLWSGCREKKRQLIFPSASNVISVCRN